MEAHFFRAVVIAASVASLGAGYRTTNFVVSAASPQLAVEIGQTAERYRRDLAVGWLGRELPDWPAPCPITVQCSPRLGAGGATSFWFDRGRPYGWRMVIQGSRERLLDSVVPHEVLHTIFATHFGRPLPRWADEGAATSVEHASEKAKQYNNLIHFLMTGRGIAFDRMFAIREYPVDVLPLYAQGHSLVRFLLARKGKRTYVAFLGQGMQSNNWTAAVMRHYGYRSLAGLQNAWLDWVKKGSPDVLPQVLPGATPRPDPLLLAAANSPLPPSATNSPRPPAAAKTDLAPVPHAPVRRAAASAVAQGASPEAAQVAVSTPAGESWYARGPNRARPAADEVAFTAPRKDGALSPAAAEPPTAASSVARSDRSLARPQSPQGPGQVILEWTRPRPSSPAPATPVAPVTQGPAPGRSVYEAPRRATGTVWR